MTSLESIMNSEDDFPESCWSSSTGGNSKDAAADRLSRSASHATAKDYQVAADAHAPLQLQHGPGATDCTRRHPSSCCVPHQLNAEPSQHKSSTNMVLSPARSRTESVGFFNSREPSCERKSRSSSPTPVPTAVISSTAADTAVKLTPITGRISKAKKGVPVHTCDQCIPPKTFSRAEHLRRHQLSHNPPELYCLVPGCGKVFHRKDLLDRHHQRHEQEDGPGTVPRSPPTTARHHSLSLSKSLSESQSNADALRSRRSVRSAPSGSPKARRRNSNASITKRKLKMAAKQPRSSNPEAASATHELEEIAQHLADEQSNEDAISAAPNNTSDPIKKEIDFSDDAEFALWHTDSALHTASDNNSLPSTIREQSASRQSFDSGVILSEAASQAFTHTLNSNHGNGFYMPRQMDTFVSIMPSEDPLHLTGFSHDNATHDLPIPPPLSGPPTDTVTLSALELQPGSLLPSSTVQPMFLTMDTVTPAPTLSQSLIDAIPGYLAIFWDQIDPEYPILHRATFEIQGLLNPEIFETLRCSMAALGSQFMGGLENGTNGSQLHLYATHKLGILTKADHWPLQLKQAVICSEYYTRFRGREKDAYLGTQMFKTLYQTLAASNSLIPKQSQHSWLSWVDEESRRRLLSSCFSMDAHTARYFEQTPSVIRGMDYSQPTTMPIFLTGDSRAAWDATSEEEWEAVYQGDQHTRTAGQVLESGLETSHVLSAPFLDLCLLLLTQSIKLIPRASQTRVDIVPDCSKIDIDKVEKPTLYTHTPSAYVYMALYYTPLHVVLSVTGDSWVFNKKVLRSTAFEQHKQQLAMWRDSANAAVAVAFATRALRGFLDIEPSEVLSKFKVAVHKDISDFWGIYVCALVCWVFGRTDISPNNHQMPSREATLKWLQEASQLTPKQIEHLEGRTDAKGVIILAKEALEQMYMSSTCILLTDALGVLGKLEEGSVTF